MWCFLLSFALLAHFFITFTHGHVEFVPLDSREAYEYRVGALRSTRRPAPPVIEHRWSTSTPSLSKHVWLPESRVYQIERKVEDEKEKGHRRWSTTTTPPYRPSRKYPQYPTHFEMFIPYDYDLPEYIGKTNLDSSNVYLI